METKEYLELIGAEPKEVKHADDGDYDYQPVSHLKDLLDTIFGGDWSFDLDRDVIGNKMIVGKGRLSYTHPVTGRLVIRSGMAAVPITMTLKQDYPKLESACLSNACKKIGRVFGRDLNKKEEDDPGPVIFTDKSPSDLTEEEEGLYMVEKKQLKTLEYYEDAEKWLASAVFKHRPEMKAILNAKPRKSTNN